MEPLKQEMQALTMVVSDWIHEYLKEKNNLDISEDGNHASHEFTRSDSGDFNYQGIVDVYEDRHAVEVRLTSKITVSERMRKSVAELLAYINFDLVAGQIGLNFENGEIRYKGTIEVKDGTLSVAMVNNMVDRGISLLDRFLPAVMDVAFSGTSPKDAYEVVKDGKARKAAIVPDPDQLKNVWAWEHFAGNSQLKAWAEDLKRLIEHKGDKEAWSLAGRSIILINSDENYCRQALRRVATDAGMKFVNIPEDEVMDLPPASSFRRMAPLLVYLEKGRWKNAEAPEDESKEDTEAVNQFQSYLARELRTFNPAHPVVFATSSRQIDWVTKELKQVGLFERFVSLAQCSLESVGLDFIDRMGRQHCGSTMLESPGKIGRLISWHFSDEERCDLAILSLKRIHASEKRPVEFLDLVHISTHDLVEEGLVQPASEDSRKNTAYHEAGHAIMFVLESEGKDIPDYTSILPGASGFAGVTVDSFGYNYSTKDDDYSYKQFRGFIRMLLSGRAGEELIGGAENVTAGASNDLERMEEHVSEYFGKYGFAPSMEKAGQSESNLAVIVGKASQSECAHVEKLVREFAAEEYRYVLQTLTKYRPLMDDMAARLLWDPVVDQNELAELCKKHGVKVS